MTGCVALRLPLNGEPHDILVEPRRTWPTPSARIAASQARISACTVLLDGDPVRACLLFAVQARGRAVRTVEGLADGETLHPLQRAFMEHHGLQCGFCTPGVLMLAAGVLERDPALSEAALRDLVASNLCRYQIRALLEVEAMALLARRVQPSPSSPTRCERRTR